MTSRTAARFGLADRGRIATGLRADLVLLDPARYVDTATYDDPCQHPDGVVLRASSAGRPRGATAPRPAAAPARSSPNRSRRWPAQGVTTILPKCARASISS